MSFLDIFTPDAILSSAERVADNFFDSVVELAKWGIERRRQLACWRALKIAAIIELTNQQRFNDHLERNVRRAERGWKPLRFRPRKMWLRRRQLLEAEAECEANKKIFPELAVACKGVEARIAFLKTKEMI